MSEHRRTTAVRVGVLAVCVGVAVGASALRPADASVDRTRPPPAAVVEQALPPPQPSIASIIGAGRTSGFPTRAVAVPVRLRIPKIAVDTGLERLGLERDGSMQPPSAWGVAGWYSGGPRPGQVGPAVIVGHIDSTSGPAVFFHLSEVRLGDSVLVTERGGAVLRFVVDDIATFVKAHFPTTRVYGPQPLPVLRLITCTGAFDPQARSYLDNLVVSAHLANGSTVQP